MVQSVPTVDRSAGLARKKVSNISISLNPEIASLVFLWEQSNVYISKCLFVGILLNTQHSEAENYTWLSQDAQSFVKTSKSKMR